MENELTLLLCSAIATMPLARTVTGGRDEHNRGELVMLHTAIRRKPSVLWDKRMAKFLDNRPRWGHVLDRQPRSSSGGSEFLLMLKESATWTYKI